MDNFSTPVVSQCFIEHEDLIIFTNYLAVAINLMQQSALLFHRPSFSFRLTYFYERYIGHFTLHRTFTILFPFIYFPHIVFYISLINWAPTSVLS